MEISKSPGCLSLAIGQMYNWRTIESGRPIAPKSLAEEFYKFPIFEPIASQSLKVGERKGE
ncbi:hypothetical protein GCM10010967_58060 [Dyadobacter beijingensis]|uniref:Uncharacterized protein n=1 Tax=Dyadobacter beijingensis TaxID=365489 RepID=A0ABQ2IM38_9BACT|nr:hypothetical protein GCM10010967_58060 [Dyadobacter beijingensis]